MKKRPYLLLILLLSTIVTGCTQNKAPDRYVPPASEKKAETKKEVPEVKFSGIKGESINIVNNKIEIDVNTIEDNKAKYFNTEMPNGQTVYFFVVKDGNGVYRAAANACEVCNKAKKGFKQIGNDMVCEVCGNKYPLEKIATEKGGCNPGPINPDLKIINNKLTINQSELTQILDLF